MYSEVEASEGSAFSVMDRELLRRLYPDTACGYKSDTIGLTQHIRHLRLEQVCECTCVLREYGWDEAWTCGAAVDSRSVHLAVCFA